MKKETIENIQNKAKVKAWCVVDVENLGLGIKEARIFAGASGSYHIFKSRKQALAWRDKQFFPAKDMGWRAVPCVITLPKNK